MKIKRNKNKSRGSRGMGAARVGGTPIPDSIKSVYESDRGKGNDGCGARDVPSLSLSLSLSLSYPSATVEFN
jgi:hypothetical protein